jgi:hypothetical protein
VHAPLSETKLPCCSSGRQVIDASKPLPFEPGTFDAVFCNDSMCHIPGRQVACLSVLPAVRGALPSPCRVQARPCPSAPPPGHLLLFQVWRTCVVPLRVQGARPHMHPHTCMCMCACVHACVYVLVYVCDICAGGARGLEASAQAGRQAHLH